MAMSESGDKPKTAKRDCCKSSDNTEVQNADYSMASDLVKFIKVKGILKQEHKDKEVKEETDKTKYKPTIEKKAEVTEHKDGLDDIVDLIQIHNNESKRTDDIEVIERPDWTATNYDMAKDLTQKRANIARDEVDIPGEIQHQNRSSLSRLLIQLPFHTLLVKWRMSFNFPVYSPRIVYGILSRFGLIQNMGTLSPNSAYVVFQHEYHACRAVMAPLVGFNYCPLICCWWYIQRYRYPIPDPVEVKREDLLLSDGRLERNSKRHIAQIKREFWRKAAALSYDVSTFRP